MRDRSFQAFAALPVLLIAAGCVDVQSALNPAGGEAERIHTLSWILIIFCSVVFLGVAIATMIALFGSHRWRQRLAGERLVIGAGLIFPAAALSALLGYSVIIMGMADSAEGEDGLRISVVGERWWWRVIYIARDGRRIESANELRVPTGQPVRLELTSADVIHSFWVPKLAGKLDMIPGRTNTLTLSVSEPGISRGQCAEYCGGAHALMSFFVIAMPPADFETWLARESEPAAVPVDEAEIQGHALFVQSGCGACHTVRGTDASGTIAPDLTHVGNRHSLAAATLPNNAEAFASWIRDNQHIKPENLMPPYEIYTERELGQLATYLESLR
jgi:cytochrome c oxidase subunit II